MIRCWRRGRRMAARMLLCRTVKSGGHKAAERMLFQPSPEPFLGVEFSSVGGEAIHAQAVAMNRQGDASDGGWAGDSGT